MMRKFAGFMLVAMLVTVNALAQSSPAAPAAAANAPAASAPAASTPGYFKIGIINIQQAILASNEGQRDFQDLQRKFEPKQAELQNTGKEIDDLKKQLNTQGDKLNEEARNTMVKNIESKQKSMQRSLEDAQADFQAQQNDIANRVGGKMLEVLDKYAKDNGYLMILDVSTPQSPVLWAGPSTDVTKAIVDAYNAQSGVAAPAGGAPTKSMTPKPTASKPATSTSSAPKKP
jgi:outer membrane protein